MRSDLRGNSRALVADRLEDGREEAARKIKCPVLILHPERDAVVPIDEGRLLASLIPDSRFVQLDSENHMPLADEPAWPRLVDEVRRFLAEPNVAPLPNATDCRSTS